MRAIWRHYLNNRNNRSPPCSFSLCVCEWERECLLIYSKPCMHVHMTIYTHRHPFAFWELPTIKDHCAFLSCKVIFSMLARWDQPYNFTLTPVCRKLCYLFLVMGFWGLWCEQGNNAFLSKGEYHRHKGSNFWIHCIFLTKCFIYLVGFLLYILCDTHGCLVYSTRHCTLLRGILGKKKKVSLQNQNKTLKNRGEIRFTMQRVTFMTKKVFCLHFFVSLLHQLLSCCICFCAQSVSRCHFSLDVYMHLCFHVCTTRCISVNSTDSLSLWLCSRWCGSIWSLTFL